MAKSKSNRVEPHARPPGALDSGSSPAVRDTRVVRAAIHPAIGVARVGNSAAEFFYGPEVTDPPSEKPGFYKDATGAAEQPGGAASACTATTSRARWSRS